MDKIVHRVDCINTSEMACVGCVLSEAYEAIRMLLAQESNPMRDSEDRKEYKRTKEFAKAVLPEFKDYFKKYFEEYPITVEELNKMTTLLEADIECRACKGTGIYIGYGEHEGVGVVCNKCKGTGCEHIIINETLFTKRKIRDDVTRVIKTNPGLSVTDKPETGGILYKDWLDGKPFPKGHEMRKWTCPAWWYQNEDYKRKPDWDKCEESWGKSYSQCKYFTWKNVCWEHWDKEYGDHNDLENSNSN